MFAIEKQYAIVRSYVKAQLKALLVEGDGAGNIFIDAATRGSFRVLRKQEGQDWDLLASVAFKDNNWVITE